MKLAVVGSTVLADDPLAVKLIIMEAVERYGATQIISGGAVGVDTIAEQTAHYLGLPVTVHRPAGQGWPYFRARNLKIAEDCDALLRIASKRSTTYGSGWTRDRAREMGKPTEEVVLP